MIVLNFHSSYIGIDVHDIDKFLSMLTPLDYNHETKCYEIAKLDLSIKEVDPADITGHCIASQKDAQILDLKCQLHNAITYSKQQEETISELRVQLENQNKQKQEEETKIVC